jgi:transcriptional regulator with XRE-family HTH domain
MMTKSEVMVTFGKRMEQARLKKGWSIRELARRIGVESSTLSSYELDLHEPRIFYATCIADALEVSLDWLTGRSEVEWLA